MQLAAFLGGFSEIVDMPYAIIKPIKRRDDDIGLTTQHLSI
jgi:hypothetical protein